MMLETFQKLNPCTMKQDGSMHGQGMPVKPRQNFLVVGMGLESALPVSSTYVRLRSGN